MAVITAAIIAGGASLAGGYMANRSSAKQAQLARDEASRYSGTAHQREVADLRAAGLNPILSGTGGPGASTPSGMVAGQRDIGTPAVQSALAATRMKQEIKNMKATEKLTRVGISNAHVQNHVLGAQFLRTDAEAEAAGYAAGTAKLNYAARFAEQPGHLDAAKFWSSGPYAVKRRVDAAAQTARILIPFTTPGHSAYGHRKR